MKNSQPNGRILAVITGVFSIAISLIYLILITILDARGPMLPPPQEALGVVEVVSSHSSEVVQQLYGMLIP